MAIRVTAGGDDRYMTCAKVCCFFYSFSLLKMWVTDLRLHARCRSPFFVLQMTETESLFHVQYKKRRNVQQDPFNPDVVVVAVGGRGRRRNGGGGS